VEKGAKKMDGYAEAVQVGSGRQRVSEGQENWALAQSEMITVWLLAACIVLSLRLGLQDPITFLFIPHLFFLLLVWIDGTHDLHVAITTYFVLFVYMFGLWIVFSRLSHRH
jgi:hypothetical protein